MKPRNPLVALAHRRHAGAHGPSLKAQRRLQRQQLLRALRSGAA